MKLYFKVDRLNNVFSFLDGDGRLIEECTLLEADDFASKIVLATEAIKTTESGNNA